MIWVIATLLFNQSLTLITSDSGYNTLFTHTDSNFKCPSGLTKTINFSGTFANIPQVIVTVEHLDIDPLQNDFMVQTKSITTISFQVQITCSYKMWFYFFRWAAIDDARVEVINNFNVDVTNQGTKTFILPHSNINAQYGYVTYLSFGFTDVINLSFSISSITSSQVTVEFSSTNAKITILSFQVILGTAELLTISSPITTSPMTASSYYTSSTIAKKSGCFIFMPVQKLSIPVNRGIRFWVDEGGTSSTLTYKIYAVGDTIVTSITHQYVWINVSNPKVLYPMLYKKMGVQVLYDQLYNSKPLISVTLIEPNLIVTEYTTPSPTNLILDQAQQTLRIKAEIKCQVGKKITATLLKMSSPVQNIITNQNCFGGVNMMILNMQFYQQESVYQKLAVTVTSTSVIIKQTIYNKVLESYNVVQINLSNI